MERELISPGDRDKALAIQAQIGGRLGAILVRIGAISEDALLQVLSAQLGMSLLGAEKLPPDADVLRDWLSASGVPPDWWVDQEALAWEMPDGRVRCVAKDPFNDSLVEVVERCFGPQGVEWCLVRNHDLERRLEQLAQAAGGRVSGGNEAAHLRELAEEAPVIEFVNNLLAQAADQQASDVHIEPQENQFQIRFRIDGVLYTRFTLPKERFNAIASRIKLISGMDIAERRLPQDGRLRPRVSGEEFDLRISAVPGIHGESIVMRLLPVEQGRLEFDSLGFAADQKKHLREWVRQPHGIVLVTGPTGSGKSTTLYTALEEINDGHRKIITVEDPVEYQVPGITQIQTLSDIDYTFAKALRAILRQDPDVIMIGEIRDLETAEIAVQASLTGHLVLSTLHTNDAASAFTRLVDMGVEPFLIATPVRAVMAQRLVRRLCPDCARPADPLPELVRQAEVVLPEDLRQTTPAWRTATEGGCSRCQGTGHVGRIGIFEMIGVTPAIQRLIIHGSSQAEIWQQAREQGSRSLREDGLVKAWQGLTSVEEVLRATAV